VLMLGGYASIFMAEALGVDPFLSLLVAGPLLFLFGLALNGGLFAFVERLDEESKIKNSLLISFGLTLVIQNAAQALFSADDRSVASTLVSGGTSVLGIALPYARLAGVAVALVAVLVLRGLLVSTYFGS